MTELRTSKDRLDPAICGDDGPISPEQCALWLDAKYRRHGELEDRAAAMWLRKLSTRLPDETSEPPSLRNLRPTQLDFVTAVTGNARLSGMTKAQFLYMIGIAWDARDAVPPPHELKANQLANTPRFEPAIEAQGMAWWNNCTEAERAHWLKRANSAAPADAWQAFRTSENGREKP